MKKLISLLLCLILLVSPLATSSAQTTSLAPEKDEVVYAKFDHTGAIDFLSVVNVFRLTKDQTIVDYGDYESAVNLTSLETLTESQDQISVPAKAGVFYYQGNGPKQALPWLINLDYQLDGQAIKAEDLAGKDGRVQIHLTIKQNPAADPVFFKHYVLQVSLQFPQDKLEIVKAEGATEALNGEDKLLTYTVLPGKEGDFVVTGDITNFSMKPVMINGLPFSMAFDLPDMGDSLSDLTKLQDGIKQLNDGAQALANGLGKADSGGSQLLGGADTLAGSGSQMSTGMQALQSGLEQYRDGIYAYRDGVAQFDSGFGDLVGGIRDLSNGLHQYASGSDQATAGLNQYIDGVNAYVGGIQQMLTMVQPIMDQLDVIKELIGDFDIQEAIDQTIKASDQIEAALKQLVELLDQQDWAGLDEIKAASAAFLARLEAIDADNGLGSLTATIANLQSAVVNLDANLQIISQVALNLRQPDLVALGVAPDDPNTQALLQYMASQADQLDAAVAQINATTRAQILQSIDSLTLLEAQLRTTMQALAGLADLYRPIDQMIQNLSVADFDDLKDQIRQISERYSQLNAELKTFLTNLSNSLPETVEKVKDAIDEAVKGLKQLSDGSTQLLEAGEQVRTGFKDLNQGAHSLADGGQKLLDGAILAREGSTQLVWGISTLASNFDQIVSGTGQISWGLGQLANGMLSYRNGISAYLNGIALAGNGSRQLAGGTDELYRQTASMDKMFQSKIDEMTAEFLPKDFTPVSFVSPKNKTIKVVQFVLMGKAINLPAEATPEPEEPAPKNIWERIKDLF